MSPSAYPGSYDALSNPSDAGGDFLDSPGVLHDAEHANANDAIEAIEHELGLTPSGSWATVRARFDYIDSAGLAEHNAVYAELADVRADFAAADANLSDAIDAVQANVDHNESDDDARALALTNRIIAVEDELGPNPSGVLETVADRLDAIELLLGGGGSGDATFEEVLVALALELGNSYNIRPTLTDPLDPVTTTTEINNAIIALSNAGGGILYLKSGDYYIGVDTVNDDFDEPWWHGGVVLHPNVTIQAEPGARFVWADAVVGNSNVILTNTDGFPATLNDCVITVDPAQGDSTFTVDAVGTLADGDRVLLRLGQNPYDPAEVTWWAHATVTDVTGNDVTLDRMSPFDLDVSSFDPYTSQSNDAPRRFPVNGNAMIRKLDPDRFCDGLRVIGGLEFATLDPARTPSQGFAFYNARNIQMDDVSVTDCHGASMNYCESISMDHFRVNHQDGSGEVYFGRGISFGGVHHLRGRNWHLEGCTQNFLMAEADCRDIRWDGLHIIHNNPEHSADAGLIGTGHGCHIKIHSLVVEAHHTDLVQGLFEGWTLWSRTPYGIFNPGTETLEVYDLELVSPVGPLIFDLGIIKGGHTRLLTQLNGTLAEVELGEPEVWASDFGIRESSTLELVMPDGVISALGIFLTDKTGITSVTYENDSMVSPVAIPLDMLIEGEFSLIGDDRKWREGPPPTDDGTPAIDTFGVWGYQDAPTGHKLTVVTDGSASGAGLSFGSLKVWYLPILSVDGEPTFSQLHGTLQSAYRSNIGDLYQFPNTRAGFFGVDPIPQPAAVPVTVQGIYDALVDLGLIEAPGS